MGSQADSPHMRTKSNPIYTEQQEAAKDVHAENNDGIRANKIETEREFADWYDELEDGLLEAGYEEYQYETPLLCCDCCAPPRRAHIFCHWIDLASMT